MGWGVNHIRCSPSGFMVSTKKIIYLHTHDLTIVYNYNLGDYSYFDNNIVD